MADQSKWIQKACSPTKPFIRPIRLLSYDDCVLVHYFDFTLLAGDGCTYGTMCKLLTDNSALVGSDSDVVLQAGSGSAALVEAQIQNTENSSIKK
ncbi:MAG: hypothetical protein LQ352_002034 [Teloschistes flavicans]|nr:MAG: hypothetical protein LQ352_002034 [Teloschistes flavicans]